jgi:hypothetical protein
MICLCKIRRSSLFFSYFCALRKITRLGCGNGENKIEKNRVNRENREKKNKIEEIKKIEKNQSQYKK